jgi:hypothetical protein
MGRCVRNSNWNFCRDNWVWGILRSCNKLCGIREMNTAFWLGNPKDSPRRPRHRWDDNIKVDFMKDGRSSTGFICQDGLD